MVKKLNSIFGIYVYNTMINCLKYNNCNLGHMYDELLLTNDISLIKYPSKPRVNMY